MSGIFGILRFDGQPVSARELDRMGNMLAFRGPDGRQTVVAGCVGLGHCLLRVNAEDWNEAQPIHDGDVTLVADLRLDNREALAAEMGIAASDLNDMPDSALLLAAYRHWGETCAEHLLGDFTFAIWDAPARALLIGRDHMGQRGLFYHHGEGLFVFATEVKALWAVEGVPRRLSEDAIGRRLLLAVDRAPGETFFERITALPNATLLRVSSSGIATRRIYWEPRAAREHLGRDEAYYLQAYRRIVEEAVACRVRRLIRPPALCFSGGFDSGSIAALAGPIAAAQGRKIIAIASVLEEGGQRPAVRDARAAVEAFRASPFLDLHYYVRGEDETVFDDLETSFDTTHNTVGTLYVRRGLYRIAAAVGARLVMDGHGGDYTVNVRPGSPLGRMLRRGQFRRFVREFRMRMQVTGDPALRLLRNDVLPALVPLRAIAAVLTLRHGFVPTWRRSAIAAPFASALFASGAVDPSRLRGAYPVHNRWRARWLHLLRKSAAAPPVQQTLAAAHGLEFTRPFHDKRVVELGLALPESVQFRDGLERYLARHALADILPEQLLARGPGNDAEDPDLFRMAKSSAPAALAEAKRLDRDGRLSRYVDLDRLEAMIANADEASRPDHHRLMVANLTITLARFVAWFDRAND
ncbi:asparagine synthase-related protein [Sphingomonas oligophenolica]|uniref:asparagine synthase (glutamine-hydrolyzing) n=1 Tax=Sphingomonas oligophenolica TaxID=301154 RepID=A0ABU9XZJ2_9SPHN